MAQTEMPWWPMACEEMIRLFTYSTTVVSADFLLLLVISYHPGVNVVIYLPIMLICWEIGFENWDRLRDAPLIRALLTCMDRIVGDYFSMMLAEVLASTFLERQHFKNFVRSEGYVVDLKYLVDSTGHVTAFCFLFFVYVTQFFMFRYLSNFIMILARVQRFVRLR